MIEYHKINTIFKRDPADNFKTLLLGQWSEPEFGYLAMNEWVFTEKVDGMNIRVMADGSGEVRLAGKTDNANLHKHLVARLEERFTPQSAALAAAFPEGVCLYGEGYGAGIQKGGGNYRADKDFVLFDVKVGDLWLQREDVEKIAADFGLDIVPIIGRGTLHDAAGMASVGITSTWGDFRAEGLVARPATELRGRRIQRIITKIKTRDFH